MTNLLVDTSVVSIAFKRDSRASLYDQHLEGNRLLISVVTRAELYFWSTSKGWGSGRTKLLLEYLSSYGVLDWDDQLLWIWARIRSVKGRPRSYADAWIAATALRYDLPLVTHNRRDFDGISGLKIISEE